MCNLKLGIILKNKEIDELSEGVYSLHNCKVKRLINDVIIKECYNSRIGIMHGDVIVEKMQDYSKIETMSGNSKVGIMYGNSIVKTMNDSKVEAIRDNAAVYEVMKRNKK